MSLDKRMAAVGQQRTSEVHAALSDVKSVGVLNNSLAFYDHGGKFLSKQEYQYPTLAEAEGAAAHYARCYGLEVKPHV